MAERSLFNYLKYTKKRNFHPLLSRPNYSKLYWCQQVSFPQRKNLSVWTDFCVKKLS